MLNRHKLALYILIVGRGTLLIRYPYIQAAFLQATPYASMTATDFLSNFLIHNFDNVLMSRSIEKAVFPSFQGSRQWKSTPNADHQLAAPSGCTGFDPK